MFVNKIVICTTLLLLSSAVHSQILFSLNNNGTNPATIDGQGSPQPIPTSSSSSSSTSTSSTTTTTSTVKPSSSTTSSTSTSTTTTTTSTEAPKTTTTPAPVPTTTHAPQPYPAPTAGTWNATCILLTMATQFNFTYTTKNGNTTYGLANIPSNATIGDHVCDSKTIQSIQLSWGPASSVHSFLMRFESKNSSIVLTQIYITYTLNENEYPDAKANQTVQLQRSRFDDLKTPERMSYHCTRPQHFNLTETYDSQNTTGVVTISQLQVEAFRQANATGFSTVHDCDSSETSDVVPIAVGIALVSLILVVLISYLCARRRSTSRGYMSF